MKVFLVRHSEAEHLKDDWKRRVSYRGYLKLMKDWEFANLTPEGEKDQSWRKTDFSSAKKIYYSPLARTAQTAKILNIDNIPMLPMPELKEVFVRPPFFLRTFKLSIRTWIWLSVYISVVDFTLIKVLKQAKIVFRKIEKEENDLILVSHEARIATLLLYALFSRSWRTLKRDLHPLGVSIIEKNSS